MAGAVKADFPCGGLHAYGHAARSGTPMGSCMWGGAVRRFACGSPAVIESSPPMGAQASRLYVADFPCGGGFLRVCLASLPNRIHH